MKIISFTEAWKKGLSKYFTGKPCKKKGHISERYSRNGGCVECLKETLKDQRAKAKEAKRKRIEEEPEPLFKSNATKKPKID